MKSGIKKFSTLRSDTILASFIVAIFASFLMSLAFLLIQVLQSSLVSSRHMLDYFLNIYILIVFSVYVFYQGSRLAAWLVYRHDFAWGYAVGRSQIYPIFSISFSMALVFFFAIRYFIATETPYLAYLEKIAALSI